MSKTNTLPRDCKFNTLIMRKERKIPMSSMSINKIIGKYAKSLIIIRRKNLRRQHSPRESRNLLGTSNHRFSQMMNIENRVVSSQTIKGDTPKGLMFFRKNKFQKDFFLMIMGGSLRGQFHEFFPRMIILEKPQWRNQNPPNIILKEKQKDTGSPNLQLKFQSR